jgi:hypothetical protein
VAGAAVDKLAFDDAAPIPVEAPDYTPKICERLPQFEVS